MPECALSTCVTRNQLASESIELFRRENFS